MMGRHDPRRDREFPPRWTIALGIVLILLFGAWGAWSQYAANERADDAAGSANALADQVETACKDGAVKVDGQDICSKAEQVKKNVDEPAEQGPEGPQGPRGRQGIPGPSGSPGRNGEDSDIPGPAGRPGEDSTVPGPAGERGAPGTDGKTITGPPGSKGEKGDSVTGPPGPRGDKGEKGSNGRGISDVTCTADSDWLFEFTDGTSVTVAGPCRAQSGTAPTGIPAETP